MLTFQTESLSQARPDGEPLLRRHWQEIAHYLDIVYAPRWDVYEVLEKRGDLRIYTARLDSVLIGYCAYAIGYSLHYGASLEASEDVLYLAPEHRKGRIGIKLIRFADELLRADGVQVVSRHVKAVHDHGSILEHIGYEFVDKIYKRRLDLKD